MASTENRDSESLARPAAAHGKSRPPRRAEGEIALIGAGIAGMTAALALAKRNIPSVVYEQASVLQEVGAGIQLAPNATRLLRSLGVLGDVQAYAAEPDFITLNHADSGKTLLRLPIKPLAEQRWRAPYYTIHRADMQKILHRALAENPLVRIVRGAQATHISGAAQTGFTLHFAHQSASAEAPQAEPLAKTQPKFTATAQARRVFCCDGVWSRLRANDGEKAEFSSYIAWRAVLPRAELPQAFIQQSGLNSVSAYMSKDSHFIIYPLRKGALYNFVVLTKGDNIGETWSRQGDKAQLLRLFGGRSPLLRQLIKQTPSWTFWPLFQMPFSRFLSDDGKIFLGDAAHAVTPFAAQGAAMAIEDAVAAAQVLAEEETAGVPTPAADFARFSRARKERLAMVAQRGEFNRFIYHLSGPAAFARNLIMRLRPQQRFLTDLDWLYSYDAAAPCSAGARKA